MNEKPKYHKRRLPHYDSPVLTQFVTFRLADSLPVTIFEELKLKLKTKQIDDIEYHRMIERALDIGSGTTYLKNPAIARMVSEAIMKFDGQKYHLIAWVIMPNHVHILLKVLEGHTLSEVMHSIKSFTANEANRILERSERFWSPEYFDRFMRDMNHLARVQRYIDENPVKAGLSPVPEAWPWGSAGWKA